MTITAVFIDRDGTLGGGSSIIYPGEFTLSTYAIEAITLLKDKGIPIFGFTNQPGIAEGKATISDFEIELTAFGLDQAYICPHSESDCCSCRKPKPGMLLQAATDHRLNLENCIVVGDRWSDMIAAEQVRAKNILVRTGAGSEEIEKYFGKRDVVHPNYIADNILTAIQWSLNHL